MNDHLFERAAHSVYHAVFRDLLSVFVCCYSFSFCCEGGQLNVIVQLSMKCFLLINVKIQQLFMSRKNSILGLSKPEKS